MTTDLAPVQLPGTMLLSEIFPEDTPERRQLIKTGEYTKGSRTLYLQLRPAGDDYEVMSLAAVSRDPGKSEDYLSQIADFQISTRSHTSRVEQYRQIYANEGIVNNAINKIAAILSGSGSFKIRNVRKGKVRKAADMIEEILTQWQRRVNASGEESVVTGTRGLKAVNHTGVRQALVEGSWIARAAWSSIDLGGKIGKVDLPLLIQSLSISQIEVVLPGTQGLEQYWWKPSNNFLRELRNPSNKDVAKTLKKFLPKDMSNPLKKDGKVLLDPALLIHVKNRGTDDQAFGESLIQPAMSGIAYRRAIDQLDIVVMQNLINRLTIVQVGSSDPTSPYHKTEVAKARTMLMQQFFDDPGPNMTIIWTGDDVEVIDVGAHNALLDLDGRHKVAESKIKASLGVPDALLSGTTTDGKAAGWAATIGAAAQLGELQNRFEQIWTSMGERIAIENGFTDVDLIYQFDQSLLVDRIEEINMAMRLYTLGLIGIETVLDRAGIDAETEFVRRAVEQGIEPTPDTIWSDVFVPPQGIQGAPLPFEGRPPDDQSGKSTPERPPESTSPEEKK